MRAILLAAGYGTRLRPLTDSIPKCLVPINGKPLLEIWLDRLSSAGFDSFLINTHYLSEQVEDFVNHCPYKEQIETVFESILLGTGGTLIRNLGFFQNHDGLLVHADNYCLANINNFVNAHFERPASCLMTMMSFRTETPSSCGILELDENSVVMEFHEKVKSPPGNLANGAIYMLSPELLSLIGNEMSLAKDFSTDIVPRLMGRIFSYETSDLFLDIGTPESYEAAVKLT
ncbi:MAG: nucleotidyltransferase family protein [Spirulina sp. SIO3F2]|nr:nucleotidyltransferase family protein [Spirulina sp. SIO3F2]